MLKVYFIAILFALVACDTSTQEAQNQPPQKVVDSNVLPITPTPAPTAKITAKQVRKAFENGVLQRLLAQEEGRKLNLDDPHMEDGLLVSVADIDRDGQLEGIVQYNIMAGEGEAEDRIAIEAIYIYPSKNGKLLLLDMTSVDLPIYPAYVQQIEDGVWTFKSFSYAEEDPRCCPSIEGESKYQLTELFDWKKVD